MPTFPTSPADLLDISGSYWRTSALHAGVRLDVFTPLAADGPMTAPDLAARLGCDARALAMLLGALTAMGLLVKSGPTFAPADVAKRHLVRDAPGSVCAAIRHHQRLMASWARLPEAVRTGRSVRHQVFLDDDPGEREDFLMAMFDLASAIAPGLAHGLDLSGRRRLLDLGGGPGTYAVQFCLANPALRATIFDLAGSAPFAASISRRFGVADRVAFQAGDYLRDPVPGGFDVVWLSQILHAEAPDGCRTILAKAAAALEPGGSLFVHDFLLDDSLDGPEFATLFSLNMLLGTPGGQAYAVGQVRDMLVGAGLERVELLAFRGPNDSRILHGRKS